MKNPLVIIVTGPPGAGKTVLGKRLSQELRLPFINKDDLKEILFETLGWEDRQWSARLGKVGFDILFHFLECQLAAGKSAVVETAFIPKYHNARFLCLRNIYRFKSVQIFCTADDQTLFERFIKRTESGERHPGHVDHLTYYKEFTERMLKYEILDIGGPPIEVETTNIDAVNFEALKNEIESLTER